jgi:hypothetical protein
MHTRKIAAIVLLAVGALALGYGGLGNAEETHHSDSTIHLSVDDSELVNVPVWAGAGAIVLMVVSRRRS